MVGGMLIDVIFIKWSDCNISCWLFVFNINIVWLWDGIVKVYILLGNCFD